MWYPRRVKEMTSDIKRIYDPVSPFNQPYNTMG